MNLREAARIVIKNVVKKKKKCDFRNLHFYSD